MRYLVIAILTLTQALPAAASCENAYGEYIAQKRCELRQTPECDRGNGGFTIFWGVLVSLGTGLAAAESFRVEGRPHNPVPGYVGISVGAIAYAGALGLQHLWREHEKSQAQSALDLIRDAEEGNGKALRDFLRSDSSFARYDREARDLIVQGNRAEEFCRDGRVHSTEAIRQWVRRHLGQMVSLPEAPTGQFASEVGSA